MRFPEDISYGAEISPSFNTEKIRTINGVVKRNRLWSTPLYRFECAHKVKTQEQLEKLIEFFYDVGGGAYSFRFKNWADYSISKQNSELQRTTLSTLKVYKKYSTFSRRITKIVDGTFKLYADDILVNGGYSVDIDTGIITLANPEDYIQTVIFTCETEYDFWVMFERDDFPHTIDNFNMYSVNQISLIEDKENI